MPPENAACDLNLEIDMRDVVIVVGPRQAAFLIVLPADRLVASTLGFSFQGVLSEAGTPADGTYDFRFVLFDDAVAGAQVGSTILVDDLGVTNGLFEVQLGFGAAVFIGEDRWVWDAPRQSLAGFR